MITIKEYKAMIEGATDIICYKEAYLSAAKKYNKMIIDNYELFKNSPLAPKLQAEESLKEIEKEDNFLLELKTSRNLFAELIRVIELAEEALESCSPHDAFDGVQYDIDKVELALSEIRKLKGE